MTNTLSSDRLLDEEAGEELDAALRSELVPGPGPEGERHRDVAGRKPQALADADGAVLAMQDPQVEREQGDHDPEEGEPEPGGLAQEGRLREGAQRVHAAS